MADQPQPALPLDVLAWHQKMVSDGINDAREQIEKQMKGYVIIFAVAFAVAGALITFAGWLGYKNAVDRAVESVKSSIAQDVRTQIVKDTAAQLQLNDSFARRFS